MTEYFPAGPATTTPRPPADPAADDSTGQAGTVDLAKDQAVSVGQGAAHAGQHVAGVAKDQAQNVAAEAGSQAKDLLQQARTELGDQAGAQQQRVASGLHALGDELRSMSEHSEQPGVASDLVRQGASKSHDVASWLDSREPGHLVDELKSFARQRPGTFLLAAAGAGLLAGRLTRGVKDAANDDSGSPDTAGAADSPPALQPVQPFASSQDVPEGLSLSRDGL